MITVEDTPENYIEQIIKQVLSKATTEQLNKNKISYINFNNGRKRVETKRVDKLGRDLSSQEFIYQGLDYFDKNYKQYSQNRNFILNALKDYAIVENYFNY